MNDLGLFKGYVNSVEEKDLDVKVRARAAAEMAGAFEKMADALKETADILRGLAPYGRVDGADGLEV